MTGGGADTAPPDSGGFGMGGFGMGNFGFGMAAQAEFWAQAGKAVMQAQDQAGRLVAEAIKAIPGASAAPSATADLAKAGQAMSDLWMVATGLSQTMSTALVSAGKAADPTVDAALRAVTDPRTWLASMGGMDEMAGKIAAAPQLADAWNAERQQARLVQAWLDVRRCGLEHNAVLLEAWLHAGQAFTQELGGRTGTGGSVPDNKAMLALWTGTANRVLLTTQRSERFLKTQAAMIRAETELRMAQQQVAEAWAKGFGLPTRTEMDDVHRTVTDLRRELRALKRQGKAAAPVQAPGKEANA